MPSMQGGDGEESYQQNSGMQNRGFDVVGKPSLARAIELYKAWNRSDNDDDEEAIRSIRIADFGCSYGRNTLDCARFVVGEIVGYSGESGDGAQPLVGPLELHYFFVDLPSNDFNSLFRMLHDDPIRGASANLFPAAVGASFYDRVLPKASLDIAFTIYSVHWLSQAPPEVLDKSNAAWNGGHLWIPRDEGGNKTAVAASYAKQFQEDFRRFLRRRAEEMTRNGVLFVLSVCRTSGRVPNIHIWTDAFEAAWNELIDEGIVEASDREAFNVSFYHFTEAEFKEALQSVDDELELMELRVFEDFHHLPAQLRDGLISDPSALGKVFTAVTRSVTQPSIEAHIGPDRTSQFFARVEAFVASQDPNLYIHFSTNDLLVTIIRKK